MAIKGRVIESALDPCWLLRLALETGPLERCFTEGAPSNRGKSSLVGSTCELLDPFGGHRLVKLTSASIFCSLVLVDFQLCFPFVKNIRMDGSNWEFNNFLMFLMVLGYSIETDIHFFNVSPFCAKTIHAFYFLLFLLEQSRLALKSSFFLRVCV